jgi:hypothetical protein
MRIDDDGFPYAEPDEWESACPLRLSVVALALAAALTVHAITTTILANAEHARQLALAERNRADVAMIRHVHFLNAESRTHGFSTRVYYGSPTLFRDLPLVIPMKSIRVLVAPATLRSGIVRQRVVTVIRSGRG